jgi:hypothetical protein
MGIYRVVMDDVEELVSQGYQDKYIKIAVESLDVDKSTIQRIIDFVRKERIQKEINTKNNTR